MTRNVETLFQREAYPLEIHAGRDIGAGYLRGWGLEFGRLSEDRLAADPLFQGATLAAQERGSLLLPHKMANLYLIIRYAMQLMSSSMIRCMAHASARSMQSRK